MTLLPQSHCYIPLTMSFTVVQNINNRHTDKHTKYCNPLGAYVLRDNKQTHWKWIQVARGIENSWKCKELIPWMVNVALSLSTEGPRNITEAHWTLVPLYWGLAGMVRFCTELPSGVVISSERTRSLRMSGRKVDRCVPLTSHKVSPPLVSHVKTAGLFRKTVVFSGAWRISGEEEETIKFWSDY